MDRRCGAAAGAGDEEAVVGDDLATAKGAMMKVGLIGLGAMGRVHFECWRRSKAAQLVAISARDPRKLAGDWSGQEFNLGAQANERVDLTGLSGYALAEDLINDPEVELVDLCVATPLHAPLAIAAMRAGKHVFCEKPMALTPDQCAEMEAVARETGRQLMIGHCLRYWPHYVKAAEIIRSEEYGRPVYARLERVSAMPGWSSGGWLQKAGESGGVLDLHIHDIDVALWWFGQPAAIATAGVVRDGLATVMDASWRYLEGTLVQIHGAWDANGGPFRHAFKVVLQGATLSYDLAEAEPALRMHREGVTTVLPVETPDAYQAELDDFARCCSEGRAVSRFTPQDSRLAVEFGLRELQQLGV
jgi:predicted dehydrogenase